MSEYRFETNFVIDNVEEATKWLQARSGKKEISIETVLEKIPFDDDHIFYFDERLCLKERGEKGVHYVWIDTELHEAQGKKELFLSLYNFNGDFTGHYVGSMAFHAKKMAERHPWDSVKIMENKKHIEQRYVAIRSKRHEQRVVRTELIQSIDRRLITQYFTSDKGLISFVRRIGKRIVFLKKKNRTQYYVSNSLENVIINTGLMDKGNRDIYLLYRWDSTEDEYIADALIRDESDYINYGFTSKQYEQSLQPIEFFDSSENNLKGCSYPNDAKAITAFLRERHDTLPAYIKILPRKNMAERIETSMNSGIAIQKHDSSFIKPVYSAKSGSISYLMPMHILNDRSSEPDMVMSFSKKGDRLEMKGLLPYDNRVRDGIVSMNLYGKIW